MPKCSPELLSAGVLSAVPGLSSRRGLRGLPTGDAAAAAAFVGVATPRARAMEQAACRLRFSEGRSAEATAAALGVPPGAVRRLIRRASLRVELQADVGAPALQVLFEDEHIVAMAKPPGLRTTPVHRWQGGSLLNRLIGHLGGAMPLPVHRLDMDTSGVVVMAKHREAAAGVQQQFERRQTRKEYLCLARAPLAAVERAAAERRFEVDAPIGKVKGGGFPEYGVVDEARGGKASLTRFETIEWASGAAASGDSNGDGGGTASGETLLRPGEGVWLGRARPLTGRTHQIRVHAAHAGLPLLGDAVYAPQLGEEERQSGWMRRHALHAAALELAHPISGEPMRIVAALPEDMLAAARAAGLREEALLKVAA